MQLSAKFKKILKQIIVPALIFGLLLLFDQLSKLYFVKNYEEFQKSPEIIDGFFRFYYVRNEGAAFSFLADKSWAQTFFIILTPIALCGFLAYYIFIARKRLFTTIATALVIAGTVGNFIDRVSYNYVVDFLSFTIFGSDFATFNLADSYLVIGVIMILFFYIFLDEDSVLSLIKNGFGKKQVDPTKPTDTEKEVLNAKETINDVNTPSSIANDVNTDGIDNG